MSESHDDAQSHLEEAPAPQPHPQPLKNASVAVVFKIGSFKGVATSIAIGAILATLLGSWWMKSPRLNGPEATVSAFSGDHKPIPAKPDGRSSAHPSTYPVFALVPQNETSEALAAMTMSSTEKQRLRAALKRDDTRLAIMPIATLPGKIGARIMIKSGSFSQVVTPRPAPQSVILPINRIGEVRLTALSGTGRSGLTLYVGTVFGPMQLPTFLTVGDQDILQVTVQ